MKFTWDSSTIAVLIVSVFVLIPASLNLYAHRDLFYSNARTAGRITSSTWKHGCTYSFSVGGQDYEKQGDFCNHEPVGERINVYYSAKNPDISLNHSPDFYLFGDLLIGAGLLGLFFNFGTRSHKVKRPGVA